MPEDAEVIRQEIAALPRQQVLIDAAPFIVFCATAEQVPCTLREIGRLREIAFRNVGEGTGRARDLDRFDRHYVHLCLWNQQAGELAGAYRLVQTERAIRHFGLNGLYTHTLFDYGRDLVGEIGPAIELGRSFIRVEYQRDIAPLFLLWKGIGRYVAEHPECKRLFGPVSISNSYGVASRSLMIEFLRAHYFDARLAARVRPRTPVETNDSTNTEAARVSGIDELSALVSGLEGKRTAIPILLKQYLKLGGRLIGFNLDREFSDAVDGLIVVDLTQTDPRLLERYLGEDGARRFLEYHSDRFSAACA
jgi:putative hemolysin